MACPSFKYPAPRVPFRALTYLFVLSVMALLQQPFLPSDALAEQPHRQHKVIILYGRVASLPANKIMNDGLLPALKAAGVDDADQYQEYLDLERMHDPGDRHDLAGYLRKKYSHERFDAIILFHQDALEFMLKEGKKLFGDTPIVAAVPKHITAADSGDRKVIQLVFGVNALNTLHYALDLLPETKELIVISGPTAVDATYHENALAAVKQFEGKLAIRTLTRHPLPEILREVAQERDHAIILYTRMSKDSSGKVYLPPTVLSDISKAAKSPVFGLYDSLIGCGIVGGDLLSYKDMGKEVARLTVDLMNGMIDSQKRVVSYPKHTPMFDWVEMQRWGLDASRLPKGSVLINYRPGFWEQYWGYALIALMFVTGEGALIAVLVHTHRKRLKAEANLRASERLLKSYLNSSAVISWMKDEEGRHLFRNETYARRFAAQSKDWQGKTDFDLWPQEIAEEYVRNDQAVLRSGQTIETIERAIEDNGDISWWLTTKFLFLDADGKRFIGGFGVDFTEIKQAKETVEFERALMLDVMNATDVSLVYLDREFNFVAVNNAYASTCKMRPEEMLGKNHFALYPGEETESIFRQVRDTGAPVFIKDRPFEFPDQPERGVTYWDWSLIPVKHSTDTVAGLVFSLMETTARKKAEDERINLERQLLHAQKIESLGILAGGIAHDFNNILTSIVGNADLALMQLDPESLVHENIKRIEKSAQRAADLAKQMLAYSGKGKFVVEMVDFNREIEEVARLIESSISKKAELRYNFSRPLPLVDADAAQIRQVIMNLVTNASEAIGDQSGTITVTTGWKHCDKDYLRGAWLSNGIAEGLYVFLEIADTGCGMDRATLAKIFDPFFTTKFTGRGLGLAAVQGIVRGHKGAIQVYSEPGNGSVFRVLLPASEDQAEQAPDEPQGANFQGEGTVLLVDDEEAVRDIGKEMLQLLGFTVVTAQDGKEALAVFRENPGAVCVILDLTMPQMDGRQCLQELRKLDPKVKVIMSSGYSEQEIARTFVGHDLSGFIQKPYTMKSLIEVFRIVVGSDRH